MILKITWTNSIKTRLKTDKSTGMRKKQESEYFRAPAKIVTKVIFDKILF